MISQSALELVCIAIQEQNWIHYYQVAQANCLQMYFHSYLLKYIHMLAEYCGQFFVSLNFDIIMW